MKRCCLIASTERWRGSDTFNDTFGYPYQYSVQDGRFALFSPGLEAAKREIDAATARVQEAQANYNKVAADLKRMTQLVQKDEISQQQYDAAIAAESSARATLEVLRGA